MTTLQWVPVDDITRQAREVSPGRTLLTLLAAVFFALGWVLRKTFMVIWFAAAWVFVATREGWQQAGGTRVSRGSG